MSPLEPNLDAIKWGSPYTISEACDIMKSLENFSNFEKINWVNSQTGKPVYIGYNYDSSDKKFKIVSSKSKFIPQTNKSPKQKIFLK